MQFYLIYMQLFYNLTEFIWYNEYMTITEKDGSKNVMIRCNE